MAIFSGQLENPVFGAVADTWVWVGDFSVRMRKRFSRHFSCWNLIKKINLWTFDSRRDTKYNGGKIRKKKTNLIYSPIFIGSYGDPKSLSNSKLHADFDRWHSWCCRRASTKSHRGTSYIPFFLSRQYRNNVRITPLWYLNYRPRSATPEKGETKIGEGFTWCTCHIWPAWGPHNECKWVTLVSGIPQASFSNSNRN